VKKRAEKAAESESNIRTAGENGRDGVYTQFLFNNFSFCGPTLPPAHAPQICTLPCCIPVHTRGGKLKEGSELLSNNVGSLHLADPGSLHLRDVLVQSRANDGDVGLSRPVVSLDLCRLIPSDSHVSRSVNNRQFRPISRRYHVMTGFKLVDQRDKRHMSYITVSFALAICDL